MRYLKKYSIFESNNDEEIVDDIIQIVNDIFDDYDFEKSVKSGYVSDKKSRRVEESYDLLNPNQLRAVEITLSNEKDEELAKKLMSDIKNRISALDDKIEIQNSWSNGKTGFPGPILKIILFIFERTPKDIEKSDVISMIKKILTSINVYSFQPDVKDEFKFKPYCDEEGCKYELGFELSVIDNGIHINSMDVFLKDDAGVSTQIVLDEYSDIMDDFIKFLKQKSRAMGVPSKFSFEFKDNNIIVSEN